MNEYSFPLLRLREPLAYFRSERNFVYLYIIQDFLHKYTLLPLLCKMPKNRPQNHKHFVQYLIDKYQKNY